MPPPAHPSVTVRHNFETGHRLPHLPGKCQSLHGHSWWAEVTITAPQVRWDGTLVEFGAVKAGLRHWIDTHLDHGVMLGAADPLVEPLRADRCKVFQFGADADVAIGPEAAAWDLPWPTVEHVAQLLGRVAEALLASTPAAAGAAVARVHVQETHVNAAEWVAA